MNSRRLVIPMALVALALALAGCGATSSPRRKVAVHHRPVVPTQTVLASASSAVVSIGARMALPGAGWSASPGGAQESFDGPSLGAGCPDATLTAQISATSLLALAPPLATFTEAQSPDVQNPTLTKANTVSGQVNAVAWTQLEGAASAQVVMALAPFQGKTALVQVSVGGTQLPAQEQTCQSKLNALDTSLANRMLATLKLSAPAPWPAPQSGAPSLKP